MSTDNRNNVQSKQSDSRQSEGQDRIEYKLHILNKNNYHIWKKHIHNVLDAKNLLEEVESDVIGTVREKQARALLTSALDETNQMIVIDCESAFDIWTRLESAYENKTSYQTENLMGRLFNYKIKSLATIKQSLAEIQELAQQIKLTEKDFSDRATMTAIINALPKPHFNVFIEIWGSKPEDERTINNLTSAIMAKADMILKSDDGKALMMRKYGKTGRNFRGFHKRGNIPSKPVQSNDRKKNVSCRFCKKQGHLISECYKLKNKKKEEGESSENKSDSANNTPKRGIFMALTTREVLESTTWILDTASSFHVTSHFNWIHNYQNLDTEVMIRLGDDSIITAKGYGIVKTSIGDIENVYYVPEVKENLFSTVSAVKGKVWAKIDEEAITLFKGNKEIIKAPKDDAYGVYVLHFDIYPKEQGKAMVAATLDQWHDKLGHVSKDKIKEMATKQVLKDLEISNRPKEDTCEACALGKCKRTSHPKRGHSKITKAGQSLHFDTAGPMKQLGLNGEKYFLICKDEFSSYRMVSFVQDKSELADEVKIMISKAQIQTGNDVLQIVTDNGTEFKNRNVESFLREKGIYHDLSAPYVPQQNGFIERDIRTISESARSMLEKSGLNLELWPEAVNTATYVLNKVTNTKNPDMTPFELWHGKQPSAKNLHVFGQKAIVLKPGHYRDGKWDSKGDKLIFCGYTDRQNTFRFYDPATGRITVSCDVSFLDIKQNQVVEQTHSENTPKVDDTSEITDTVGPRNTFRSKESSFSDETNHNDTYDIGNQSEARKSSPTNSSSSRSTTEIIKELGDVSEVLQDTMNEDLYNNDRSIAMNDEQNDSSEQISSLGSQTTEIYDEITDSQTAYNLRPRNVRPDYTAQYSPSKNLMISTIHTTDDPNSYSEAMKRKDKDLWLQAMKEELGALRKNDVWKLVDRPNGNIVSNRWVLRIKRKPNGQIDRYRARLVARGFSQIYGLDYNETYAPVVNATSIRLLFAYASIEKLKIAQFDVKTAFLYGDLDETVYMEQPEGFGVDKNKVWLLQKSLYGLKQAPRQWNIKFRDFLKEYRLVPSINDGCIFYCEKPLLILAIYVDDGIIFAKDQEMIHKLMAKLSSRFEIHEVENDTYLGFQIEKGKDSEIMLHQTSYIDKIVTKFNMTDSKPVESPVSMTKHATESPALENNVPYREAVGSLMYAAVTARPDIAYAVGKVSRKLNDPTEDDWMAVKRIIRYLKGSPNLGLLYSFERNEGLIAYCDSDFAGDASGKSTTGSVILFAGAPIHWRSQRQTLVTLSSTEAEYVSICSTIKDIVWIRKIARELKIINDEPTPLFCDNQSAVKISVNEKSIHRTRHMKVQDAYAREQLEDGEISIAHISAEEQLADMFTKATTSNQFSSNRNRIMSTIKALILALGVCLVAQQAVQAYVFERVKPIIWIPTRDHFVETGVTEYTVEFVYDSPCNIIPAPKPNMIINEPTGPNGAMQSKVVTDPDTTLLNTLRQECDILYSREWITRITEIISRPPNPKIEPLQPGSRSRKISKRSIFMTSDTSSIHNVKRGDIFNSSIMWQKKSTALESKIRYIVKRGLFDAAQSAAGAVFGVCATNLVKAIWDYVNPNSHTNAINRIEERLKREEDVVARFRETFNVTNEIQDSMLKQLQSFGRSLKEQERVQKHMVWLLPRFTWTSSFLNAKIIQAGADLRTILDEYMHTRVAVSEMADLLNLTAIKGIENKDTWFESVIAPQGSARTLVFKFSVREKSKDTFVYKVNAFRYWENLTTEHPVLLEYTGQRYLIHNETNDCLEAVDEPTDRSVDEECLEPQTVDPRLSTWTVVSTDLYGHQKKQVPGSVKRTLLYNYVYCFPLNITLSDGQYRCPPYPFRVLRSEPFEVPGHKEMGTVRKVIRVDEIPAVDNVHAGQFLYGSEVNDEVKMVDTIHELQMKLSKAEGEKETTIQIVKHGVTWWLTISFAIILAIALCAALAYNVYLSKKAHQNVMSDLKDLRSNYSEVKLDCSTCNKCTPNPNFSRNTMERKTIEVASDKSIVVNVGRREPSPLQLRKR